MRVVSSLMFNCMRQPAKEGLCFKLHLGLETY